MKARGAFLLLVLAGLGLGLALWRGESERDGRAMVSAPAAGVAAEEREVAELAAPTTPAADEPASREALPAAREGRAGEAALDVELVSWETGDPLVGIELTLFVDAAGEEDDSCEHERVASTDEAGHASFLAPAGQVGWLTSYNREVGLEELQREVTLPAAGERLALRIELRTLPDQPYFGRVVEVGTGAPVVGATARFEDDPNARATTDADGLFELQSRSWEPTTVRVEHEGHAWTVLETRPEHSTPEKAAVIRLVRSARLALRVERRDGPVAGLEMRVHTDGYWMRQRGARSWWSRDITPLWTTVLDASGLGVVAGLPPDVPLTVDVHEGDSRIQRVPDVSLEPDEERELLIRIGFGCRIEGRVQASDGSSTEGLEVWMLAEQDAFRARGERYLRSHESENLTARTRVDAAGRFTFEDVGPGSWLVGPGARADRLPGATAPLAQHVEVTFEDSVVEVTLAIHRGLTIEGRVVDPDGQNVSDAFVLLHLTGMGVSAPGGVFTLGPLAPGEYELTASSGDFARSEPVTARAGDRDVVIHMRAGGSITVVTRGPEGATVAANVTLIPDDVAVAGFAAMSTRGDEGSYQFDGLRPGLYHVAASDAFGNFGILRDLVVVEGEKSEQRILALTPGAAVRVRIEGLAKGLFLRLVQAGVPVGFGQLDAPIAVAPGPVTVQLQTFDMEAKQIVDVETREATARAGEEVVVVFDRTEKE